jgi:hypothetical protein
MLEALTRAAEAYSQHQRLEIVFAMIVCAIIGIIAGSSGMWKK